MDCRQISKRFGELADLPPAELPEAVRKHLARCPACGRRLAAERATGGLLRSLADAEAPPPGFVERVRAALSVPPRAAVQADAWRPAWGLLPAFAAAAVALVVVYGGIPAAPTGLLPLEDLTAGERLVLQEPAPSPDLVLSAILEETR